MYDIINNQRQIPIIYCWVSFVLGLVDYIVSNRKQHEMVGYILEHRNEFDLLDWLDSSSNCFSSIGRLWIVSVGRCSGMNSELKLNGGIDRNDWWLTALNDHWCWGGSKSIAENCFHRFPLYINRCIHSWLKAKAVSQREISRKKNSHYATTVDQY